MVKGLLADINTIGFVEAIAVQMQNEFWVELWDYLGLTLRHFDEVGLSATSSDLDVWQTCQAEQLILITDNRNEDSSDSLEATIRELNQPDSLPVLTISDLEKFRSSRAYADRVVEKIYDFLLRIDELRGVGRLFVPDLAARTWKTTGLIVIASRTAACIFIVGTEKGGKEKLVLISPGPIQHLESN
jgi:hypothetical protein